MNVEIVDSKSFSSLEPLKIERYLLANGWEEQTRTEDQVVILETKKSGQLARIWLPLDRGFEDFDEVMGRVIRAIAKAETRSQLEVLEDFSTIAIGDVIRLTTFDRKNRESTTIPISDGIALIEKAKRIATAAALSTESKKPVFPTYRPPTVSDYLDSVRLGQTETGSYKIKLISPLPLQPDLIPNEKAPFERSVVITLMESLFALKQVSTDALRTGRYQFEAFMEAVNEGVSANLCEAVTDSRPKEFHRPIDISVTWSSVIQASRSSTEHVEFDPSVLFFVEKAGKDFRERHPELVSLRGMVRTLTKDKKGLNKKIVVIGVIDDRFRSVHIDLEDPKMHDVAIEAYKEEREIVIHGILRRVGKAFKLDRPEGLRYV